MAQKEHVSSVVDAADSGAEDAQLDTALRPRKLKEFIGQETLKKNLGIFLTAAKERKEPIEHVLFHGSPGLGKTTLAHVIANELGVAIRVTSGPALERVGDLAAVLTNLKDGDIFFIDEIHRLHHTVEEMLYPAMEDYALDIVLGKGPGARTVRLELPHFTLIGATTRLSLMSSPLRSRFGVTYPLSFYTEDELVKIVERSAKLLKVAGDRDALSVIGSRSRKTPRVANRLLKRVRDYAQVHKKPLTPALAAEALNALDIDALGLDESDRRVLKAVIEKFQGGPVGLATLAAATGEDAETIETVFEPFLMQIGLLARTPRGRVVTATAYTHLGIDVPANQASLLSAT